MRYQIALEYKPAESQVKQLPTDGRTGMQHQADDQLRIRICGSDPNEPQGQSNSGQAAGTAPATSAGTGAAVQSGNSGSGETGAANAGGASGDNPADDLASKYEAERQARRQTQKELDEARETLENAQRAQNDELTNLRADADKLKAVEAQFAEFKTTTFLKMAIMQEKGFNWHDKAIDDVRSSVDLSKVKIDNDGNVDGLSEELKRIAKDKDYLLRPAGAGSVTIEAAGGGAGGGAGAKLGSNSQQTGPASGAHPFGQSGGNAQYDKDYLKKKYKIA